MRQVEISDELYDKLKDFVVDPFDDTAEVVIDRLVGIAMKAKDRWSALEGGEASEVDLPMTSRTRISNDDPVDAEQPPVLL